MNLTCNRDVLQKYIIGAERVTSKNSSLPILSSILLTTTNNTLIIRSTNLEVGVEFQIPAEVKEQGSIAIQGSLFSSILNSISEEEVVKINVVNNICKITTKTKNITIKGLPTEDYPTIPIIESSDEFTIKSVLFIQNIKSVLMSAAVSDIKPEISSVYMYQKNKELVFVATDSFRLAEKKTPFTGGNLNQGFILPIKNITEIIKILEPLNENILIKTTKTQIAFITKSVYITSRIIQGIYPDYEQILPKTQTTEVVLLKQDLINTLKLSTIFSDKFNKTQFIIDPKIKKFIISTKNTEVGETEVSLEAAVSGEPIDISLNSRHLFDCLNTINQDSVVLNFSGAQKPVCIKGVGDDSFVYLTMPLTR